LDRLDLGRFAGRGLQPGRLPAQPQWDEGFLDDRQSDTIFAMRTQTITPDPSAEIWQQVIEFRGEIAAS
jgi:hypothetical protein